MDPEKQPLWGIQGRPPRAAVRNYDSQYAVVSFAMTSPDAMTMHPVHALGQG